MGSIEIGIAPIGWTNDDMPELGGEIPFEQCISEMALAGYSGCEVGSKYPRDINTLKEALALRKLQICNAWFSSYLTTQALDENLRAFDEHCTFLHSVGARIVGISEQGGSIQGDLGKAILSEKPVFSEADWRSLTSGIARYAGIAKGHGIAVTYHHHMGTGVQTVEETRRLLDETDPEQLSLLYDTGHFFFSGEDPHAALEEFLPRIAHIHLKDVRTAVLDIAERDGMSFLDAVKAGVFTVPGDGDIDFQPIFDTITGSAYTGWMVVEAEQDPAKANPLEYAMKGREYIQELAGM